MKHYFLLFAVSVLFSGSVFSQQAIATKNADFFERNATMKSEFQNQKVVLFRLVNTMGYETQILDLIGKNEKVFEFKMKDQGYCYAILDKSVTPDDVRNMVSDLGVNFDITSIKLFNRCFIDCSLPADFPVYQDNGNPKADKNVFIQNLDSWRKLNPGLYEKYFGL